MKKISTSLCIAFLFFSLNSFCQQGFNHANKFEQLGNMLSSPNDYRSIDGTPGPEYWQQKCDYEIACELDTENRRLQGSEKITYLNRSPHTLKYLWLQLDENQHSVENDNQYFDPSSMNSIMSEQDMRSLDAFKEKDKFGVNIEEVKDVNGKDLDYFINQTMMRVNLPSPLKPGGTFTFNVKWNYYLVPRVELSKISGGNSTNLARGGYEYFPDDGNDLYTITQWYPRLCAYTDFQGWQNNQFTGRGEFALTFGDFKVDITVPEDQVVGATGECSNYQDVLTGEQYAKWQKAQTAKQPMEIVTLQEAKENEKRKKAKQKKTWKYEAENVRDFAWTASRKFIWDAMAHTTTEGRKAMCMSYYGKEAYPIYRKYSTEAVNHTLEYYSKYSIPYPYPTAISVEAASGMEYPMICFNPGRAEKDGTYTQGEKNSAISVIIHEVGHNYFPMIINSDERQWAWFDEGLNSFVQFLAEQEWNSNYGSWFGPAAQIVPYMSLPKEQLEPIMTNGENILDYFQNAYSKPATALNILRETIMGRELFDAAFQEYCERWAFKHPTPADFFRTMEDASAVDLDWFWKGWFYGIDHVDISLDSIKWYKADLENNPKKSESSFTVRPKPPLPHISQIRNKEAGIGNKVAENPNLQDIYTYYEPWKTVDSVQKFTTEYYEETFSKKEKKEKFGGKNYYELHFSNKGGLVMPVIMEWTFEDGSKEIERIPVEIWRKNENSFTKVFVKEKVATAIIIDPYRETADTDRSNNDWPVKELPTKFQVFKANKEKPNLNPMQRAQGKTVPGRS